MADAPLPDRDRQVAIGWLENTADQLELAAMWADGSSPDRERLSIALEDSAPR